MNSILAFLKANVVWVFALLLIVIVGLVSINDNTSKAADTATIAAQKLQLAADDASIKQLTTDNGALRQAINIEQGNQGKVDNIINQNNKIAQSQSTIEDQIQNVPVNQTCLPFADPGLNARVDIMRNFQREAYPDASQ